MIKVLNFDTFSDLMKVLKIFLTEVNLTFHPSGKLEITQLSDTRNFCFLTELHGLIEKTEDEQPIKMRVNIDQLLKVCKVITNTEEVHFTPKEETLLITALKNGKKIKHSVNLLEHVEDMATVKQIKKFATKEGDLSSTFTPYQLSEINENLALYDDRITVMFADNTVSLSSKSQAGSCSYDFTEDCAGVETINFGSKDFKAMYDNKLFQNICKITKILSIDYVDLEFLTTGVMFCNFNLSNTDYVKVTVSPYENLDEDDDDLSDDDSDDDSDDESE